MSIYNCSFSENETKASETFSLPSVRPSNSSSWSTETAIFTTAVLSAPVLPPAFDTEAFKVGSVIVYALIFAIGVPGNILVLLTLIRIKKMRSVKNIFIANLAVGDLLNLLWCMTSFVVGLYVPWPFGQFVCTYIYPMTDVIIGNTIFTMVAIACDRYRAIVQPFSLKLTIRKSFIILLLLWASAYLIMGFPLTMANQMTAGFWVSKVCSTVFHSRAHELTYRLTIFFSTFFIPFILVLYCYIKIRRELQEHIAFATSSVRGSTKLQRAKKNQRLIKMLLVIFMAFTICYLPVNILVLTHMLFREEIERWPFSSVLYQVATILLFGNSIMNPIILFKLSRDYKHGFYSNMYCIFCCTTHLPERKLSESMSALKSWVRRHSSRFRSASITSAASSMTTTMEIPQTSRSNSLASSIFGKRRSSLFSQSCFKSMSTSDVNQTVSLDDVRSPQLTHAHTIEDAPHLYYITRTRRQEFEDGRQIGAVEGGDAVDRNRLSHMVATRQIAEGREMFSGADHTEQKAAIRFHSEGSYIGTSSRKSVTWAKQTDILENKPLVLKEDDRRF